MAGISLGPVYPPTFQPLRKKETSYRLSCKIIEFKIYICFMYYLLNINPVNAEDPLLLNFPIQAFLNPVLLQQ